MSIGPKVAQTQRDRKHSAYLQRDVVVRSRKRSYERHQKRTSFRFWVLALSLVATGLGPTRPAVDPGQPFPSSPLAAVNSPVDVTVNGKSADMLAAVGYPGAVDGYQVNFRVPPDVPRGIATVQVSAAWIAGPLVSVAVQ